MSRRAAITLIVAAFWTVWVWTTRIWNILRDAEHDAGFKAVHSVLAVVSIGFAVAIFVIGVKGLRHVGAGSETPREGTRTPA
jgi:hypothetical protein